ncbi:hypothetical protein OG21DRAFT_1527798 [Imleria badia]|nr:hypothetical protein OG21DRAFT_1527798 [Imleria badia]
MAGRSRKRLAPGDDVQDLLHKKPRSQADVPARRSNQVGKGTGGAIDQLKKTGDALLVRQKKREDHLADEDLNLMAPEEVKSTKKPDNQLLPDSNRATLRNGLKILDNARKQHAAKYEVYPNEDCNEDLFGADSYEECAPGDDEGNDKEVAGDGMIPSLVKEWQLCRMGLVETTLGQTRASMCLKRATQRMICVEILGRRRLTALQQAAQIHQDSGDNDSANGSDVSKPRSKRYSKTPKTDCCADPTQHSFYPLKWKDFLDDCKVETRTYAAVQDPWLQRRMSLNGFLLDVINMIINKWKKEGCTVEKGYYPKHKHDMCELLFEDLASWRSEIKKAATAIVHTHYKLFLPRDNQLSAAKNHKFVKHTADDWMKKPSFAHGGKDDEAKFGTRIPNATLSLAATAIWCILDGYKTHGKAKFPNFSGDMYRAKWKKFNDLIAKVEEHDVHAKKLEHMCREIARTGIAGGTAGEDLDMESSGDDEYGVIID